MAFHRYNFLHLTGVKLNKGGIASAIYFGVICYAMLIAGGIAGFSYYFFDISALFIVFGMSFVMLWLTNLTKAFFKAFELFVKEETVSLLEVKRSLQAVKLVIVTALLSGGLVITTSIIACLHRMEAVSTLGPTLATACIGSFYGVIISLCLAPIAVKLTLKLSEGV